MKTLLTQKRLASQVMGVGRNKVWFDPTSLNEIKEAITKSDIEALIKDGVIKKKADVGVKRRAGRIREARKRKGRRRGVGKTKMTPNQKKRDYMTRIRNIRSHIQSMKRNKSITHKQAHKFRRWAKASLIRSRKDLIEKTK